MIFRILKMADSEEAVEAVEPTNDVVVEAVEAVEPTNDVVKSEEEQLYEQMFANRYTEEDPGYAETKELPKPPCIFPWYERPKRFFDWR